MVGAGGNMIDSNDNPHGDADDYGEPEPKPSLRDRWRGFAAARGPMLAGKLDQTERSFLGALRFVALLAAGVLILVSVGLLVLGFIMQWESADAVETERVAVTGAELAPPQAPAPSPAAQPQREAPRWSRILPEAFRNRYYGLYRSAFAPSYRQGEKPLEAPQFFELMFPDDALDLIEFFDDGRIALAERAGEGGTRPLLESLLAALQEASATDAVRGELQGYKSAQRVEVCRSVQRTRTRSIEQWDYGAQSCPYWFEPPYGCMGRRQVSEPYQARECSMQFPDQLADPARLMRDLQGRYFGALDAKIAASQRDAETRRMEIISRNARGKGAVWDAVFLFGAFLTLMFLYLLVALERHHRTMARAMAARPAEQ